VELIIIQAHNIKGKGDLRMKEYVNFDLTGKVAVVIGGTRGIGRALALGLAESGADVCPISRNEENSKKIADEIRAKGRKALSYGVDATDYNNMCKFRDILLNEFGHVDILVNSQGMDVRGGILELSVEGWRKVISVNQESVFVCMKIFGEPMVKQRKGKIINVTSSGSFLAIGGSPAYCASKGAVNMLTMVAALEWAPYNVQVNAIAPGWFHTDLTTMFDEGANSEIGNNIIERIPMGRTGKTGELAGACVYLASEASNYVTGSTIAVDGGWLCHGISVKQEIL